MEGSSRRTKAGKIRYAHNAQVNGVKSLSEHMKNFKYKEYTKLMSPEQVKKNKSGSCHDQVMYEMSELRKLGIKPKAKFVMEYDNNGQGGMTHSFVYYKNGDQTTWMENAWKDRAGVNHYDSIKDIEREIRKAHKEGTFGNRSRFRNLVFTDFNDREHTPGETLQELVNKCLRQFIAN